MSKIGERKLPREKVRNKSITVAVSEIELNQLAAKLDERETASGKLRELLLRWLGTRPEISPVTNGSSNGEDDSLIIEHCVQGFLTRGGTINGTMQYLRNTGYEEPHVKLITDAAVAQYHARKSSSPTPTSR